MRSAHVGSTWVLDAAVVAAGLVAVGLLVFATRLTSSTLDRNSAWTGALGSLRLDAGLSYAWLEAAIAGSKPAAARREFLVEIDAAQSRCRDLLPAGAHPVEGTTARAAVTRLCSRLASFRAAALERLRTGGLAYAPAFTRSLRAADEAQRAIGSKIAARRRTLDRVDAGVALLVLVVFVGMAAVVARRSKHLAVQNERLRRLDRLKDDFVAAVSHELRTPLTSTIGFLQTLERPDLRLGDERRLELIKIARVQAERLALLVDQLLFFSDVQTGLLRLSPTTVDLVSLADECVRSALPAAQEKGVTLRLDAGPVPPFRADRARLEQLLENLVSNALKFTPSGGRVDVRTHSTDGRALLEVADTGIGIPAAEQVDVFDRFHRTTAAGDQAIPGSGLGLAIVKAIVDAHGGSVDLASEEARGTTVRVELPLAGPPF